MHMYTTLWLASQCTAVLRIRSIVGDPAHVAVAALECFLSRRSVGPLAARAGSVSVHRSTGTEAQPFRRRLLQALFTISFILLFN